MSPSADDMPQTAWGDDNVPDWDAVEGKWNEQITLSRESEDTKLQREYNEEAAVLQAELVEAIAQHTRLTEALLQARVLVDEKHADLDWLDDQFEKRKRALEGKRAADDLKFRAWIDSNRGIRKTHHEEDHARNDQDMAMEEDSQSETAISKHARKPPVSPEALRTGRASLGKSDGSSTFHGNDGNNGNRPYSRNGKEEDGVQVINPDGDIVGQLRRLDAGNHWVQKLLRLPIQRSVEIRMGRKFTQGHLDAIFESKEPKKTKWLSFMIQATGELQARACNTCAKGQGLYSLCIIVGGSDFPRCGNCEWNKQGCHGAAPQHSRSSKRHSLAVATGQHLKHSTPSKRLSGHPSSAGRASDTGSAKQPPNSLVKARPGSAANGTTDELSESALESADEIKKTNLLLKDDGMIFLEPITMRGVPLRKITPDHAYWEPDWKTIEDPVRTKLDEWTEKLATLKSMPEHTQTERDRTSIFQAGRQVNRGKSTLKFLLKGDFHPFQIIGKQWITPSLAHYDTLFRMVATLEELAKFKMDVTPLQWFRQRLHEIYLTSPNDFKLDRVVAKMYHDPKLSNLRLKNGFGNIGRPSTGARPSGEKRKEATRVPDSASPSPAKRLHIDTKNRISKIAKRSSWSSRTSILKQKNHSSPTSEPDSSDEELSRSRSHTNRTRLSLERQRDSGAAAGSGYATTNGAGPQTHHDDIDYSGYTSTDSLTGDPVVRKDWRVHQVKTMHLTSNPGTTQYWHWIDKCHDSEPMFEHQVLKEMEPATSWGIFKEPIDFHLRLRELTNIAYSQDSHKVVIGTRQVEGVERRGNVLAHFKRDRTKRRFLTFMHKQGVDLVRTQGDVIEGEWNRMRSEVMAGGDSD